MSKMERESVFGKLQQDNQGLANQVADLTQRLEEWQDSGLPVRLERLENDLHETNVKLSQENILRGDVEVRLQREITERATEQAGHTRAVHEAEALLSKLNATQDRVADIVAAEERQRRMNEDLKHQIQDYASRTDELEGATQSERYRANQLTDENQELRSQVHDLSAEVSRLRQQTKDHVVQSEAEMGQRMAEQEAMQAYRDQKERERTSFVEEKRNMELAHSDEVRVLEAQSQYKLEQADTRYVQLQREYENMHELLMRVQQENKSLTSRLESQRGDANERMNQVCNICFASYILELILVEW